VARHIWAGYQLDARRGGGEPMAKAPAFQVDAIALRKSFAKASASKARAASGTVGRCSGIETGSTAGCAAGCVYVATNI